MELAASALFAASTAGTATAATAATTAATAGGLAAATSGTLSALQTGMTVASMISTAIGGVAGYQSHQNQARFTQLEASGERLAGQAEANRIQKDLLKKIGDNRVAFAGAGLDVSSGREIEQSLRDQAAFETSLSAGGAEARAAGRMAQSASQRSQGYGSLISAAGKMADRGLDTYLDISRRK